MTLAVPCGQVTHRRVLAIALPMTVAHLTVPLLGIVDTAVIGRLGDAALLGGVALGAVVFDFLFWAFGFLRMGTVGLAAQSLGRAGAGPEAREAERAVLARALLIALGCAGLLLVLQVPLRHLALALAGASPDVDAAVSTYYDVRIWAAPASLVNYVVAGWLTGLARTGHALALQVVITVANMALTALFVLGLGWGVAGSAAGTLIAEILGAALGLAVCARLLGYRLRVKRAVLLDTAALAEAFTLNRDIMIRTAALMLAFSFFAAQGARSGDVTLAANALLNNMVLLAAFFLDGFATAAEQICGQAAGARRRAEFVRGLKLSLLWGFGFAVAASLLYLLAGPLLIDLMTTSAPVREAARAFLGFAVLLPMVGVFAYAFDGAYIGALWSREMRNLMLVALMIYFAVWGGLLPLGNTGLWLAYLAFLAARGALQAARLPVLIARSFPPA